MLCTIMYIYIYTIHCQKGCTKLELIEQQFLPRDEQGSSTNMHHYSENTSTRYCTGVETCVYDSIATCVSAASFHCPEDSPTLKSSAVDGFVCGYTWIYQLVFQGKSWFLIAHER